MQVNELNRITHGDRKTLLTYFDNQRAEKVAKAYQTEHKAEIVTLFNEFGTIVKTNATTTTTQLSFRDDNTLHTAQMEESHKEQADGKAYIAYLESLLAEQGIAHDGQDAFKKTVCSVTIRQLTAEKTKQELK